MRKYPHPGNNRRLAAIQAVTAELTERSTNAIAAAHVWQLVNLALDAYEDEAALTGEQADAWAVMRWDQVMLVAPTKRIARAQKRILGAGLGRSGWAITRTVRVL